jgi:hypothetical protein
MRCRRSKSGLERADGSLKQCRAVPPRVANAEKAGYSASPKYGGFATTSNPAREDRDPDRYLTILSGDLNGDDDSGGDDSDNCYHVFYHPDGTNLDTTAIEPVAQTHF